MMDNDANANELASALEVCGYLRISLRTLERIIREPLSGFPRPFVIGAKRRPKRYWRWADVRNWRDAKAGHRQIVPLKLKAVNTGQEIPIIAYVELEFETLEQAQEILGLRALN